MKSTAREMPNNLQAEQALLGSVFMNNQAYHVVSSYLIPEDFYEPIHQKIWKAMGDIIMNDRVATPVNVKSMIPDFDMGGITVA